MQTQTAKQEAMQAIQQLPDTVEFGEIVYRLYVLDAIHRGIREIDEGLPGLTVDELQREITQW